MEAEKKTIRHKHERVTRQEQTLEREVKQLLAVKDMGEAVLSPLKLEEILALIMDVLSTICRFDRAVIMLVNEDKECIEYLYGIGFGDEIQEDMRNYDVSLNCGNNILARVVSRGRPEYYRGEKTSIFTDEDINSATAKSISWYVVPLISRFKVIGILAAGATCKEGVPEETRDTLNGISPLIAIAIKNERQFRRLQEQKKELDKLHLLLSRVEKFSFLGHLAARLGHEIKNSMTAVSAFIQMLPRKSCDEEFRTDFHKVAIEATTQVNNLTTELLDLVKTRKSHIELNDLHDLIDKMILLVSPHSNAKKIKIVCRYDPNIPYMMLDAEKMKQVILNILSNAVEFTPKGGKIHVFTRNGSTGVKSGIISIEIRDNGAGISSSKLEKIFDPYFTTKHKNGTHCGTGLGLFIAKKNVEDHKGSIEVESKLGEGTKFILTLPIDHSSFFSSVDENETDDK